VWTCPGAKRSIIRGRIHEQLLKINIFKRRFRGGRRRRFVCSSDQERATHSAFIGEENAPTESTSKPSGRGACCAENAPVPSPSPPLLPPRPAEPLQSSYRGPADRVLRFRILCVTMRLVVKINCCKVPKYSGERLFKLEFRGKQSSLGVVTRASRLGKREFKKITIIILL